MHEDRTDITIREIKSSDKEWITHLLIKQWSSTHIVSRGKLHDATRLPGFIGIIDKNQVGLVTYVIENDECEIVSLNSFLEKHGVGSLLIDKVKAIAKKKKCKRIWLIETNDNTKALLFYQRRGFTIAAIHKNAIENSRKLKPQIPLVGQNDIPIRDEIELEIRL